MESSKLSLSFPQESWVYTTPLKSAPAALSISGYVHYADDYVYLSPCSLLKFKFPEKYLHPVSI